MKKKILFIANTDRHIKLCHIPYLKMFKDNGYTVHVATNTNESIKYCDKKIGINLKRNPYYLCNLLAVIKMRKIIKKEKYDIISCHTPMGGILGRMSVIGLKNKPKVFYTAHGFHFYKGAPIINWLIYYNIEKFLSKYTTCLMTMNDEDYGIAKRKFKCDTYKINGIGLEKEHLIIKNKDTLKEELGIKKEFIITYIAEISKRKNQKNFLKAIRKVDLVKENTKIYLIGDSSIKNNNKYLKLCPNVEYLGFKNNVGDYINISDLIISPSKQEGLPLNILEAMYFNKMIIATDIRGTRDLIKNGVNGYLIPVNKMDLFVEKIIEYKNNPNLKIKNNINKYLLNNVKNDVRKIYNIYLKGELK